MNQRLNSLIKYLLLGLGVTTGLIAVLAILVWTVNFHPKDVQPAPVVCSGQPQSLKPGQTVKVLSWNVQYMAGKGYWFFYEGGTDTAPAESDIRRTLNQAARVIKVENPDIVLLQEVDEAASRTHYTDQLKLLRERLDGRYPCRTEAFYWKSDFVPHPDIWGPVGMKLVILSKFRISKATRHQLPLIPENWVSQQFNLKRALLAARIPYGDTEFVVMNTHLSAFAQGTDTMKRQIKSVKSILTGHKAAGRPWMIGGDFNLLPPGNAYKKLPEKQKSAYRPQTEIKPLFEAFHVIPGSTDLNGPDRRRWFTHFPNDPDIKAPNKTIDYIFYADSVKRISAHVRQADTWTISDHLPVVAEFTLSGTSQGGAQMKDEKVVTHALQPAELLQQLIRFDTTNPPGNERPCIEFIDHMLKQAGIETQILARDPDRPNLIARYPGEGHAPPFLMYGHVDVVTTENQEWQYPPFEGRLIDGYVWGRGALDMKGAVAMMVAALIRTASADIKPAGDIILAVLSDEEAGGRYGAKFLVEAHPEVFTNVKYAIGEFGGASMYVGKKAFYPIQVAEKQACWMTATLKGPAGHASMPIKGGAMAKLGRLLIQLNSIPMPPHITPVTRQMIEAMAAHLSPPTSTLLKRLLNPMLTGSILKILGERGRQFKPLFYNTVTPTVVRGGSKINVIPSEIELQLDGRLLPGHTPTDMLRELRQTIDPQIPIDILTYDPTVSEPDMTFFPYLKKILREMDPSGQPIPMILPGVTDARFFAHIGIQTYGFTPMKLPPAFSFFSTVHSGDERIPADAVEFGTNAILRLIQTYNRP